MNKKKLLVSAIVWALVVVLTCLVFFIVLDNYTKVRIAGLVFILVAVTLVFAMIIVADLIVKRAEGTMFNAGLFSILLFYFIFTFITSIVFIVINKYFNWLLLANFIYLILFLILFTILVFVSNKSLSRNNRILQNISRSKNIEAIILALKSNPKYKPLESKLNMLYEAVKYSDCSDKSNLDDMIEVKLMTLEDLLVDFDPVNMEKQVEIINEMLALYKRRGEEVKANKGGRL